MPSDITPTLAASSPDGLDPRRTSASSTSFNDAPGTPVVRLEQRTADARSSLPLNIAPFLSATSRSISASYVDQEANPESSGIPDPMALLELQYAANSVVINASLIAVLSKLGVNCIKTVTQQA